VELPGDQSFPSRSVVGAAAVLGVVAVRCLHRRVPRVAVGVAALGATVSIGVSRLYLGVHWVGDVLGGWLVGGLWLTVCVTALTLWAPRPGAGAASAPAAPGPVGALEGDEHGGRSEATATPTPDPDPERPMTPARPRAAAPGPVAAPWRTRMTAVPGLTSDSGSAGRVGPRPTPR